MGDLYRLPLDESPIQAEAVTNGVRSVGSVDWGGRLFQRDRVAVVITLRQDVVDRMVGAEDVGDIRGEIADAVFRGILRFDHRRVGDDPGPVA